MSEVYKASSRRQDHQEAFRDRNEALYASKVFAGSDNLASQLHAIQTVTRFGGSEMLARSGQMYVELALHPDSSNEESLDYIEHGRAHLERALHLEPGLGTSHIGSSALTLACLDSYQYLALTGKLPDVPYHEKAYEGVLIMAKKLRDHDKAGSLNPQRRGILAEVNILLLLQRFAIKHGGQEWTALPSLFSESNSFGGSAVRRSWDVTVMTQYDETPPRQAYKIQVKSSRQAAEYGRPYAKDIIEIIADTDIATPRNRQNGHKLPLYCVAEDCLTEAGVIPENPDRRTDPTDMLDRRTEWLLDALDDPENP